MKKTIAGVALLSVLGLAIVAHAETNAGINAEIKIKTGDAEVETNERVVASTTAMPVKGVRMEGGVNTAGGMKMEDGADMEMEAEGDARATQSGERGIENAEARANEHALDALNKVELHLDADESSDADDSTTTIDSAIKVRTDADLKHFVSHEAKKDERLKKVDVKDGTVEVDYEVPAKLLWFIRSSVNAHASADAKGNVHVSYPWYRFLVSADESSSDIEAGIKADVSANANANVAHVFAIMMKHLSASIAADGSVSAN